MRGLYWEEWEIGAEFESPARTVTEMRRQLQVLNQRGEVVQEGIQAFLLKRKAA